MRGFIRGFLVSMLLAGSASAQAPSLRVLDTTIRSRSTGRVVVSGEINGDSTAAVNIFVELRSRAGNQGTLSFTPAVLPTDNDIEQLDDPWPGAGTFSGFDTDITLTPLRNGSLDENGILIASPVTFSGDLVAFPIVAGSGAEGVWDVVLATSAADSSWEGLATTLTAGTVTVEPQPNIPTVSHIGLVISAVLLVVAGGAIMTRRRVTTIP